MVTSLTLAGLLAGGLAIGLGANVLNGPLLSGRLSFYWARPIGGWVVWAGTLGAAVVLALAAGVLALVPGLLAGAGGPQAVLDAVRLTLSASGIVLFFNVEPPGVAGVLGIALVAALLLVLVAHAAAVLLRLRSWLLLDVIALGVIWLTLISAAGRLARADAISALRILSAGRVVLLLIALLAATAAQVMVGRNDAVRGRRWLAAVLWATLAAGAAAAWGYTAWVLSPTPSDLISAWGVPQPAGGQHAFLAGPARGRGEYQPAFLVNLRSGAFSRIGGNQDREPASVGFGAGCAVWITGTPAELWVADLTDPTRERAPTHSPLAVSMPAGELVASDDCRLVAAAESDRLVVVETASGRLLASATVPGSRGLRNALVFDPEGERLRILRNLPMREESVGEGHAYIEVWELRTDQPGAQPEPIARSQRLPANASARLLPGKKLVWARYRAVGAAESAEQQVLTFPDLRPVALLRIQEGCQGKVLPLADGLLAILERCGTDHTLRLLEADGDAVRSFALPRARQFMAASQPAADLLLLGVYPRATDEPSARVGRAKDRQPVSLRTLLLDLRTGEISPVGDNMFPVFAGLGPENPAARLLTSSTEGLLLYDPASGESRPLPRGE